MALDVLKNVQDLEDLISRYHAREGTRNFHYAHFDLLSWRVWLDEQLSKEDWDRMDIGDYAVQISYTDNSNSYDSYTVLLQDIIAWGETHETR